jgi:hypothetical protein
LVQGPVVLREGPHVRDVSENGLGRGGELT